MPHHPGQCHRRWPLVKPPQFGEPALPFELLERAQVLDRQAIGFLITPMHGASLDKKGNLLEEVMKEPVALVRGEPRGA